MKNTAKKILKAVILVVMAVIIITPFVAKPAHAMAETAIIGEGTAIRSKVMPDGMRHFNIMGDHDDVIAEISKLQENGNLRSVFLISALDDVRNTEANAFVGTEKVEYFLVRLQYEGSPELVKDKKDLLEAKGYTIEGHVEFPSKNNAQAWAKVMAVKRIKY